jgi:DNA helicase-2/ATP-dependent DNA helicase PcrA
VNYLDELNEAQRKAVEYTEGPSMVLAGAGSGKTRVLTYRIAHLIHKGVSPFNILALTFTNKAAREMKERIATIVGDTNAKSIWMGTFHSVFARILRVESEKLGYPSNFTIYDTEDSRRLLKEIIKSQGLDDKVYKPSIVGNRISSAKNNLLTPAAYQQNLSLAKEDQQSKKPMLGKIYEIYDKRLFKAGAMDFDDLLFKTNILLRDHPDVLNKYQDKFRYVLVDEYQDTNFSQYIIIRALSARFENICVVGDDAQSIYSFRGANIQNILNFKSDYPDCVTFKLEQNYRSTKNIVAAANSIIEKNDERLEKDVWTANDEGGKLILMRAMSDNEEGNNVADTIFQTKNNEQAKDGEFAILYRTNAQSRAMEDALRKMNIPYKIYGGLSFYQRKEIKDLLAYFRLVVNPQDEDAIKRIINYPARGIGKTTMDRIILFSNENDIGLWQILTSINTYPLQIGNAAKNKIQGFVEMIQSFRNISEKKDAYETGQLIASTTTILKELHSDKSVEGLGRYENVQELLNSMKEFVESADEAQGVPKLADYILDIPLLTDADEKGKDDENKVTLMTIHASKGLEFPYVFVVGLEEELFPSMHASQSKTELEEERRLFYVAVTRAEKQCYLSYSESRYKWGNLIYSQPSRFIQEIDDIYLDTSQTAARTSKQPGFSFPDPGTGWQQRSVSRNLQGSNSRTASAPSAPPKRFKPAHTVHNSGTVSQGDDTSGLKPGTTVEHGRFGVGSVVAIEGSGENRKATINFESVGKKQLLLKFAKLKVMG